MGSLDGDEDEEQVTEEGLDGRKDEESGAESSDEELNAKEGAAQTKGSTDAIAEYACGLDVQPIRVS